MYHSVKPGIVNNHGLHNLLMCFWGAGLTIFSILGYQTRPICVCCNLDFPNDGYTARPTNGWCHLDFSNHFYPNRFTDVFGYREFRKHAYSCSSSNGLGNHFFFSMLKKILYFRKKS